MFIKKLCMRRWCKSVILVLHKRLHMYTMQATAFTIVPPVFYYYLVFNCCDTKYHMYDRVLRKGALFPRRVVRFKCHNFTPIFSQKRSCCIPVLNSLYYENKSKLEKQKCPWHIYVVFNGMSIKTSITQKRPYLWVCAPTQIFNTNINFLTLM